MIIRRMAEAIRKQDWFTVIIEILIVVIGIFLGLQVTNWNQARIDRADEAVFMQALHEDIVEMERISERTLTLRLHYFDALEGATDILFGRAPWRPLTGVECSAIGGSHVVGTLPISLPSLTALRDAGRTGIIGDEALLRNLAKLTQRQEALRYIVNAVGEKTHDIPRQYPDLFQIVPSIAPLEGAPGQTQYDTLYSCDSEAMAKQRAVLNAIAYNLEGYDAVVNLIGIKPWAAQTKAVHDQLDRMLTIRHEEKAP